MEEKDKFKVDILVSAKHHELRGLRKKMSWTQVQLAEYLGASQTSVSSWECLRGYPKDKEVMRALCELIDKAPEELFPNFLRDKKFLAIQKSMEFTKEIDLRMIEGIAIAALPLTPEEEYEKKEAAESIRRVLATLSPREEKVLRKHIGLEETLREISQELDVTPERIRQIEKKGLQKIRRSKTKMGQLKRDLK